ncbi:hypothetical protein PROFUN_05448 [Planoprotostelium fungivorum]|uniref:Uncharacterized protein n=1 Tax=Planoprotostelium fungivorum TaxID=1890364 RepID=A0A2P6NQS5_9EUKA|nr:hypothetical protein PROFUN_05448 [Planoprotostelium fungivorum]
MDSIGQHPNDLNPLKSGKKTFQDQGNWKQTDRADTPGEETPRFKTTNSTFSGEQGGRQAAVVHKDHDHQALFGSHTAGAGHFETTYGNTIESKQDEKSAHLKGDRVYVGRASSLKGQTSEEQQTKTTGKAHIAGTTQGKKFNPITGEAN